MQYANITVSDLNRSDFVAKRDLSQQELGLAGGWGYYNPYTVASATSTAGAFSNFGSAFANSSALAINQSGGSAYASSSAVAVSGGGGHKWW